MSDYPNPNPNLHRGDGISGRGLLIALAVLVGLIALIALVGPSGDPQDGIPAGADAIAPAADPTPALPTD